MKILIAGLLFLGGLMSCVTTENPELFESYSFSQGSQDTDLIETSIEVPEIHLFVSAPYKESEEEIISLVSEDLPEPSVPVPEVAAVSSNPVSPAANTLPVSAPVVTVEKTQVAENRTPSVTDTTDAVTETPVPVAASTRLPSLQVEKEIKSSPGEPVSLILDGEGWIFDREKSSGDIKLVDRKFADGKTIFQFFPSGEGSYALVFQLQNLSTGSEETMNCKLDVTPAYGNSQTPVVIPSEYSETSDGQNSGSGDHLSEILSEENIPGLVASIDLLIAEDSDPERGNIFDAFNLLEKQGGYDDYLVGLAENSFRLYPYNDQSAELLYRAAEAKEKPGAGQNIDKALELFRMVMECYPLSIFSDRSDERIRYLERHFMKIY